MSKLSITLKDLFSAEERDYTSGNLNKAVLYLSVPMVLEMALESVFSVVDAYFVGRLGSAALAAVGITDAVATLIFAIGIGISLGTTAMVSRRIGEKKPGEAAKAAAQSIWLGVIVSIPIAIIGLVFSEEILILMGATNDVIKIGSGFTTILITGNITILLLFILNAVFRGAGDAIIAMRILWISNAINIILDPVLIFGLGSFPELGVTGAAIATTIGRGSGVIIQMYALFKSKSRITLKVSDLKPDYKIMMKLVRISIGGISQFIISTASWIGLVRILALFGSAALAGYTIAIRIIIFSIMPSWGMANAAATLVGQNLGAGNPQRAEKSVWIAGYSNFIFLMLIAIIFISFPELLISLFTSDPETLRIGARALRIISYGYGFYAFGMVMVQAFNGAGDTMTPTKINLFVYWLFQIPMAYLLARSFAFAEDGVFWAITIAEGMLTVVSVLVFRTGKWKQKEV